MYVEALVLYLLTWITVAYQPQNLTKIKPNSILIFPLKGSVPDGHYTTTLSIGHPPSDYVLNIDTGSDLTWVRCKSAEAPPHPFIPGKQGSVVVRRDDPECKALGTIRTPLDPETCDYKITYDDGTSTMGILVTDVVHFKTRNGRWVNPQLPFGCGYGKAHRNQTMKDGVLGLAGAESSILRQLRKSGQISNNAVGHCLSSKGGGYLFLGEPPLLATWTPIQRNNGYYSLGSAKILFGGKDIFGGKGTNKPDLNIIFDSGSTYTYLMDQAYNALLDRINRNVGRRLTLATDDHYLPICWRGPFDSVDKKKWNVCLGLLNGKKFGLDFQNVIGDISMQDKLVIYDNERMVVGWVAVNKCN
ncbi:aspartic proteinase asp1 [Phtheirospermum japonicum]|uniref:Aspartic proteinase asp1 n=1 Tax=Phtheirospermum japonicum TaxID=374723 RepID=A0A830C637_9LAMI|nr:aspartic proteinase asp1 [Phtheirospermum japonicum]